MNDFKSYYVVGDKVLLIGFSCGVVFVWCFVKCFELLISDDVYFCVFDIVVLIGFLKVIKVICGVEYVIFENYMLVSNIKLVFYCVVFDEKCCVFELILINKVFYVEEIWFVGVYLDVGGGYYCDGLVDICLCYVIEWLIE